MRVCVCACVYALCMCIVYMHYECALYICIVYVCGYAEHYVHVGQ